MLCTVMIVFEEFTMDSGLFPFGFSTNLLNTNHTNMNLYYTNKK